MFVVHGMPDTKTRSIARRKGVRVSTQLNLKPVDGSFSLKESRGQRVGRFFLNAGDGPGVLDVVYAPLKAVDQRLTGEEVFFGPRADEALFLLR